MHSFFIFMLLVDAIGVLMFASIAMHRRVTDLNLMIRCGLVVLMIGMLAQLSRDIQCIIGVCRTDSVWPPLWALKDLGAALMAAGILLQFNIKANLYRE